MFKVETHDNSLEYFKNLSIEKDAIYVTANSTLTSLIREVNRGIVLSKNLGKKTIIDIEKFEEKLYSNWKEPLKRTRLKSELRDEINKLKNVYITKRECEKLNYFITNIDNVFETLLFLAECEIKNININIEDSLEDKIFKSIFKSYFRNKEFQIIYKELIRKKKLVYKESENESIIINKIYFYNISELNLKRIMLFYRLKKFGYEIIFRIPYFNGLREVNKYWENIYSKDMFEWTYNKKDFSEYVKKSKYIAFIEGDRICDTKEDVSTKTYYEISNFTKDIENKKVITFTKDSIKPCIDYSKKKYRHCYSTRLGRFIKNIYECSFKKDDIKVDYNIFVELITSGWVEYIEKTYVYNGKDALEFFKENEDYFKGVETIDEILIRLNNLRDFKDINDIFETGKNKESIPKLLINPFRALSYVNFERYDLTLNQIIKLTQKLKRIILVLLENKEGLIEYENHVKILKKIYNSNLYIKELKKDENISWVHERIKIALNYNFNKKLIHIDELKEVFNTLLSIKDGNIKEEQSVSIDHLEGFINRTDICKGYLHIADLSYKAYKQYIDNKRRYSFIISRKTLKQILFDNLVIKNNVKNYIDKKLDLENKYKYNEESIDYFLKFLIANVFINFKGKIMFSWIKDLRDNDSKSVILRHVENLYKNDKSDENFIDIFEGAKENINVLDYHALHRDEVKKYKYKHINIPEVAYKDLDFCEEKFLYSSILDPYPIYKSDFHNRVILSILVSLLKDNIPNYYDNIKKFILPLFPQWQDVVKENIMLINYSKGYLKNYKNFKGINYPKNVDGLYTLRSKYIVQERYKIRNRYNKDNLNSEEMFKEFLEKYFLENYIHNPGRHCSMCPHIYTCRKGVFRIGAK